MSHLARAGPARPSDRLRTGQQLDVLPPEALGTEEGIRLSVTLAAALFHGRSRPPRPPSSATDAIAEAERLASPVARASAYWNASLFRSESGDDGRGAHRSPSVRCTCSRTPSGSATSGRLRTPAQHDHAPQSDPPRLEDAQEQLRLADAGAGLERGQPRRPSAARPHRTLRRCCLRGRRSTRPAERPSPSLEGDAGDLPLISVEALTLLGQIAWSRVSARTPSSGTAARSRRSPASAPTARPRRSGSRSAPWPRRPGWWPSPPTPSSRAAALGRPARPGSRSSTPRRRRRRGPRRRTRRPVGFRSSTPRRRTPPERRRRSHPAAWSDRP